MGTFFKILLNKISGKNYDGAARLFNLFLREEWPQDDVLGMIKDIRDKLVNKTYDFTESERISISVIGLMIVTYTDAIIQDLPKGKEKQAMIKDLIGFEGFLKLAILPDEKITLEI